MGVCRVHYHHKLLNMRYVGLCKVLFPQESFCEIKNRYRKITAQDRSIVDVGNLKNKVSLKCYCFYDGNDGYGEEEGKSILREWIKKGTISRR